MLCIKREENSILTCGQHQQRNFTSKAIELTIATHSVDFCGFALVSNNLCYPSKSKLQKRSNLYSTRGITPKHVTSGGAHLCALATQFRIPKKKQRRNGGEPPTPIAMSLTTKLSGWYKASLNLNFRKFCALSPKLLKNAWFHL